MSREFENDAKDIMVVRTTMITVIDWDIGIFWPKISQIMDDDTAHSAEYCMRDIPVRPISAEPADAGRSAATGTSDDRPFSVPLRQTHKCRQSKTPVV
jgi:hypothetical protein